MRSGQRCLVLATGADAERTPVIMGPQTKQRWVYARRRSNVSTVTIRSSRQSPGTYVSSPVMCTKVDRYCASLNGQNNYMSAWMSPNTIVRPIY